jgi:hypothetical protein
MATRLAVDPRMPPLLFSRKPKPVPTPIITNSRTHTIDAAIRAAGGPVQHTIDAVIYVPSSGGTYYGGGYSSPYG